MDTKDHKLSRRAFVGSMAGVGAGAVIAHKAAAQTKYDVGTPVFKHLGTRIIDMHTHFMGNMDSRKFLERTKVCDKTVVFGGTDNDAVKAICDQAPDRLIFFTRIYLRRPDFMEELERTHQDLGAKGIKMGPGYEDIHPLDHKAREVYTYAQRHNLPIVSHMAMTPSNSGPLEYQRPIHADQIACDFPDLKFYMAHLAKPWYDEALCVIRRNNFIYADISGIYYLPWLFYNAIRLAIEYSDRPTVQKLFFGSDYMGESTEVRKFIPQIAIDGIRNMNHIVGESGPPPIPEEIIESILHNDSLSILGID